MAGGPGAEGVVIGMIHRLAASARWRLHPAARAVRAVMRENEQFDARHGTDTRGEIPLVDLGIAASEAAHGNGVYRAISTSHFDAALACGIL